MVLSRYFATSKCLQESITNEPYDKYFCLIIYIIFEILFAEAVLQCQARSRIEERLEVTLTGAIPSSSSGHDLVKLRAVTPLNERRVSSANNGVVVEGRRC